MATDQSFVTFLLDQADAALDFRARKMFGEYGFYVRDTFVALACDNRFFVKQTEAGRAYLGEVVEAPPYPGAKPHFLIEEGLEDGAWLSGLLAATQAALPAPKPKKS